MTLETDEASIERGKLHRGFLTDPKGRRIYFPPIGPARWVPSPDEEARFREQVMWWTIGGVAAGLAAMVALLVVPREHVRGYWTCFVIAFLARGLAADWLARRWPMMDEDALSYQRVAIALLMRRSKGRLWLAVLASVFGAVALVGAVTWGLWRGPVDAAEMTTLELILEAYLPLLLLLVIAIWWLKHAYRAATSLRLKARGAAARSL